MLILASSSPRRQQMLSQLGFEFTSDSPNVDESVLAGESANDYVMRIAKLKGESVFQAHQAKVVLSSDTIVCFENLILQKPESFEQFQINMQKLSDQWHEVKTAVCLKSHQKQQAITVSTKVKFRKISNQEILKYWQTGEPLDKAGGYAIQGIGSGFVESIEGSYSNVVGLPLTQTIELLRQFDIDYLK